MKLCLEEAGYRTCRHGDRQIPYAVWSNKTEKGAGRRMFREKGIKTVMYRDWDTRWWMTR